MSMSVTLLDLETALRRMLRRCGRYLTRPRDRGLRVEYCGQSGLAHPANPPEMLFEYYRYCVALFRSSLHEKPHALNLVFGNAAASFRNELPVVRIGLQYEHTLVRTGGRDSADAPHGLINLVDGTETYLVRIAEWTELRQMDIVIEYSRANAWNVASSGRFDDYARRQIVIAPVLGQIDFHSPERPRELISLFADPEQSRRRALLDEATRRGLPLRNIQGIFALSGLRRLYRQTRILINIHQTDHHHTFEELRVLPALMCGVIVISESSPLRTHIPYHEFIVWADYADLLAVAAEVRAHYAQHWQRMFGDGRLAALLQSLHQTNLEQVHAALALHGQAL